MFEICCASVTQYSFIHQSIIDAFSYRETHKDAIIEIEKTIQQFKKENYSSIPSNI